MDMVFNTRIVLTPGLVQGVESAGQFYYTQLLSTGVHDYQISTSDLLDFPAGLSDNAIYGYDSNNNYTYATHRHADYQDLYDITYQYYGSLPYDSMGRSDDFNYSSYGSSYSNYYPISEYESSGEFSDPTYMIPTHLDPNYPINWDHGNDYDDILALSAALYQASEYAMIGSFPNQSNLIQYDWQRKLYVMRMVAGSNHYNMYSFGWTDYDYDFGTGTGSGDYTFQNLTFDTSYISPMSADDTIVRNRNYSSSYTQTPVLSATVTAPDDSNLSVTFALVTGGTDSNHDYSDWHFALETKMDWEPNGGFDEYIYTTSGGSTTTFTWTSGSSWGDGSFSSSSSLTLKHDGAGKTWEIYNGTTTLSAYWNNRRCSSQISPVSPDLVWKDNNGSVVDNFTLSADGWSGPQSSGDSDSGDSDNDDGSSNQDSGSNASVAIFSPDDNSNTNVQLSSWSFSPVNETVDINMLLITGSSKTRTCHARVWREPDYGSPETYFSLNPAVDPNAPDMTQYGPWAFGTTVTFYVLDNNGSTKYIQGSYGLDWFDHLVINTPLGLNDQLYIQIQYDNTAYNPTIGGLNLAWW